MSRKHREGRESETPVSLWFILPEIEFGGVGVGLTKRQLDAKAEWNGLGLQMKKRAKPFAPRGEDGVYASAILFKGGKTGILGQMKDVQEATEGGKEINTNIQLFGLRSAVARSKRNRAGALYSSNERGGGTLLRAKLKKRRKRSGGDSTDFSSG